MMFPAVGIDANDRPIWSVSVELPSEIEEEIRAYVAQDELTSWTMMVHEALYALRATYWTPEMLAREFTEAIEEGLRSGEEDGWIEATPAFWKKLRLRGARRLVEIQRLRGEGKIGNLLLPRELYEFVEGRIAAGDFENATDVVCAAMPHLRASRNADASG